MKIFLDTANIDQIRFWLEKGLVDGVTTNPTHLSKHSGTQVLKTIEQICTLVNPRAVSVQVTMQDPEKVLIQAREIAAIAPNVIVKIPAHSRYLEVIRTLADEGISLNITLIFSLLQALAMCKLHVSYVSPFIGRIDDIGSQGIDLIKDIVKMLADYEFNTKLIAASIRTVEQLQEVAQAGAYCATVSAAVLEQAMQHPLTDQGIEKFLRDWESLNVVKFP